MKLNRSCGLAEFLCVVNHHAVGNKFIQFIISCDSVAGTVFCLSVSFIMAEDAICRTLAILCMSFWADFVSIIMK